MVGQDLGSRMAGGAVGIVCLGARSAVGSMTVAGYPVDVVVAGAAGLAVRQSLPVVALAGLVGSGGGTIVTLDAVGHRLRELDFVDIAYRRRLDREPLAHVDGMDHDREVAQCARRSGQPRRIAGLSGRQSARLDVIRRGAIGKNPLRRVVAALVGMAGHAIPRIDTASVWPGGLEQVAMAFLAGRTLDDFARTGCRDRRVMSGVRRISHEIEIEYEVERIFHIDGRGHLHAIGRVGSGATLRPGNLQHDAVQLRRVKSEVIKVGLDGVAGIGSGVDDRLRVGNVTRELVSVGALRRVVSQRAVGIVVGGPGGGFNAGRDSDVGHQIIDPAARTVVGARHQFGDGSKNVLLRHQHVGGRGLAVVAFKTENGVAGAVRQRELDLRLAEGSPDDCSTRLQRLPLLGGERRLLNPRAGVDIDYRRCRRAVGAIDTVRTATPTATRNGSRHHGHEAQVAKFHKRMFHFHSSL